MEYIDDEYEQGDPDHQSLYLDKPGHAPNDVIFPN
jgi:hypothetical protein